MGRNHAVACVHLHELQVEDFMGFIVSLEKKGGAGDLSFATYNGYRASLFNMYRDARITMSGVMIAELRNHDDSMAIAGTYARAHCGTCIFTVKGKHLYFR